MCELDPAAAAAGDEDEAVLSLFNAEPSVFDDGGTTTLCHHDLHFRCAAAFLRHKTGVNEVQDHELTCPRCGGN